MKLHFDHALVARLLAHPRKKTDPDDQMADLERAKSE